MYISTFNINRARYTDIDATNRLNLRISARYSEVIPRFMSPQGVIGLRL